MNSEPSKTISTCTIWLAVACILTFGVFKMNVSGEVGVFLLLFCMPLAMVAGAVVATKVIWDSRREDKPHTVAAAAPNPA